MGNDSIVVLQLTVNSSNNTTIYDTICQGDSILFGGQYYNQTGIYTDSLQTAFGCDSTVTLNLTVNSMYNNIIYDTICQGNSVLFGEQYYNQTGTYTDTLQTVFGCDSIVTLHLLVNPTSETTIYDTVCQGNSVFFGGQFYNQTGLYNDTLQNALGCDSIVTLDLTIYALPLTVNLGNDTTICWLDSLKLNAKHADATHYRWQDNSTGMTYTVYYDGQYWVVISNRCSGASDTINVSYLKDIELNLGKDTVFCEDDIIDIQLDVTSPYASYLWQDGSTLPVYTIKEAGMYGVTVSNACMSISDAIEIATKDCNCKLFAPNIFTPYSNGINYIFKPDISCYEKLKEYKFYIYNRWGGVVFVSSDYSVGWNGTNKRGNQVSDGVYYWVIEAHYYSDIKPLIKNGSVTVISK
jgi:gliding motility-associated-like protein